MYRLIAALVIGILLVPLPASAVTIDTVLVGDVGNPNDPLTGKGSVEYPYRIGTYEVTNGQYAEFLNAKGRSGTLGLYDTEMASDVRGGIIRSGAKGSYVYSTKPNMANKPVNWVSWYDAIRFCNWLNNGQGDGDTESGAYTILGGTTTPSNGETVDRNAEAIWFLPSGNEWYKAAYYQPDSEGGDVDDYWLYPTRSNTMPIRATANNIGDISNPGANVANFSSGADWNGVNGNYTTVGSAGPLSTSYFGTYDQGGNIWELQGGDGEDNNFGFHHIRGGYCCDNETVLRSTDPRAWYSDRGDYGMGFRVATVVPEPSTLALAALGALGLLIAARRRR